MYPESGLRRCKDLKTVPCYACSLKTAPCCWRRLCLLPLGKKNIAAGVCCLTEKYLKTVPCVLPAAAQDGKSLKTVPLLPVPPPLKKYENYTLGAPCGGACSEVYRPTEKYLKTINCVPAAWPAVEHENILKLYPVVALAAAMLAACCLAEKDLKTVPCVLPAACCLLRCLPRCLPGRKRSRVLPHKRSA